MFLSLSSLTLYHSRQSLTHCTQTASRICWCRSSPPPALTCGSGTQWPAQRTSAALQPQTQTGTLFVFIGVVFSGGDCWSDAERSGETWRVRVVLLMQFRRTFIQAPSGASEIHALDSAYAAAFFDIGTVSISLSVRVHAPAPAPLFCRPVSITRGRRDGRAGPSGANAQGTRSARVRERVLRGRVLPQSARPQRRLHHCVSHWPQVPGPEGPPHVSPSSPFAEAEVSLSTAIRSELRWRDVQIHCDSKLRQQTHRRW